MMMANGINKGVSTRCRQGRPGRRAAPHRPFPPSAFATNKGLITHRSRPLLLAGLQASCVDGPCATIVFTGEQAQKERIWNAESSALPREGFRRTRDRNWC